MLAGLTPVQRDAALAGYMLERVDCFKAAYSEGAGEGSEEGWLVCGAAMHRQKAAPALLHASQPVHHS